MRKYSFKSGCFFHVFNKSIANYSILKDLNNSQRFVDILDYYNNLEVKPSFSTYLKANLEFKNQILIPRSTAKIKFITYCIMPDHYHLLIKILCDYTLSKYINDVENSFTRFFNIKFERKGPLWQSSFKAVKIKTNEQLLHVSRYVHINPTTSNLVTKPEDWVFSSYRNFISTKETLKNIYEISIRRSDAYKKFVDNRINYQKSLKIIKKLLIE